MSVLENEVLGEREINFVQDCRAYRYFVSINFLKRASTFMRASEETEVWVRVKTLYRAKKIFVTTGFKPVKVSMISKQFHISLRLCLKNQQFLRMLKDKSWPETCPL